MRSQDTRDTNCLLPPTYTELKIIIMKVQISHQPSDLFSGLKTSTSIILWGKPTFQLESSDVSCKQLLSILPQKSFALLSPSHSAELRHSPGQCVLKLTLCVPEEFLCLKLHLLLQHKALSKLKTLYCTEIVTSIKPTGVFLFCLMFFENTNPQNFVESPLPKSILLFKNFLAIPPYHLGNLLIPDTFFRNSMMFQGNFWQQKKHQLFWLVSYLLSSIQNHSSFSFSITAGRAVFLTPSFPALQDVLLHCSDRTEMALYGHPQHWSFNITVTALHQKHWGCNDALRFLAFIFFEPRAALVHYSELHMGCWLLSSHFGWTGQFLWAWGLGTLWCLRSQKSINKSGLEQTGRIGLQYLELWSED